MNNYKNKIHKTSNTVTLYDRKIIIIALVIIKEVIKIYNHQPTCEFGDIYNINLLRVLKINELSRQFCSYFSCFGTLCNP